MTIDETIDELARTTVHSRQHLREMAETFRDAPDEAISDLLRIAADIETFSPPRYHLATRRWQGLAAPALMDLLNRH